MWGSIGNIATPHSTRLLKKSCLYIPCFDSIRRTHCTDLVTSFSPEAFPCSIYTDRQAAKTTSSGFCVKYKRVHQCTTSCRYWQGFITCAFVHAAIVQDIRAPVMCAAKHMTIWERSIGDSEMTHINITSFGNPLRAARLTECQRIHKTQSGPRSLRLVLPERERIPCFASLGTQV